MPTKILLALLVIAAIIAVANFYFDKLSASKTSMAIQVSTTAISPSPSPTLEPLSPDLFDKRCDFTLPDDRNIFHPVFNKGRFVFTNLYPPQDKIGANPTTVYYLNNKQSAIVTDSTPYLRVLNFSDCSTYQLFKNSPAKFEPKSFLQRFISISPSQTIVLFEISHIPYTKSTKVQASQNGLWLYDSVSDSVSQFQAIPLDTDTTHYMLKWTDDTPMYAESF